MASRMGPGPVFAFEWLMTSRRWQAYALRSFTVLIFLAGMTLIWSDSPAAWGGGSAFVSIHQQAEIGRSFFATTAMILLGLVGLSAPAATAGSICLDKARGNLTLLFATDLSRGEIVLGKFAAKMVPVLGLILCAAPVMAIGTLFGGINPVDLIGTLFVMVGVATFGCALAMMFSVWGKKTHEVLMLTYVVLVIILLAPFILWGILELFGVRAFDSTAIFRAVVSLNPFFLIIATIEPPSGGLQVTMVTRVVFLVTTLGLSAGLLAVSTWRIRSVVIGQLGRMEKARRPSLRGRLAAFTDSERFDRAAPGTSKAIRWLKHVWPTPSLDRNPVFWRECQRTRPSRMSVVSWSLYYLICGGFSLYAIALMWMGRSDGVDIGMTMNIIQVPLGLLLLSVSSATSLSEERQRGSLDVLLATPMPTWEIVLGKWRGAFRSVFPLLILPTAVSFSMARETGRYPAVPLIVALIVSYGAAITSLGLAMATWFSRMGRSVGLTTGLYISMCVAWPFLSLILLGSGSDSVGMGLASGSPFLGIGYYSALIGDIGSMDDYATQTGWTIMWIIVYCTGAAILLSMTATSFDRCLGRIDDLSGLSPWDREKRSSPPLSPAVGNEGPTPGPVTEGVAMPVSIGDPSEKPSEPA